jgi:hypothetical protein
MKTVMSPPQRQELRGHDETRLTGDPFGVSAHDPPRSTARNRRASPRPANFLPLGVMSSGIERGPAKVLPFGSPGLGGVSPVGSPSSPRYLDLGTPLRGVSRPLTPMNQSHGQSTPIPCEGKENVDVDGEINHISTRLAYFSTLKKSFEDDKNRLDVVEKEIGVTVQEGGDLEGLFEEESILMQRIQDFEKDQIVRDREIFGHRIRIKELLNVE